MINTEQARALIAYADRHGRRWQSELRLSWETGQYDDQDDSALLQQIRNTCGPSWLKSYGTKTVTKNRDLWLAE